MSRPERDTLSKEAYCPICETSFGANSKECQGCGGPLVLLEQADDSLVGQELDGRYLLKEKLGSGGMGSVYIAEQLAIERDVVIKVIRPDLSNDIFAAKRFLREAKMASRLSHPHTISVFEFGQTSDGLLFLAMELLRGETLHELMEAEGAFDHTRACEVVLQILDGLAAAHACDIVHRDLKPANIVILDDPPGQDFVKILDFGLAKSLAGHNTATEAGMMMGTPAYMPPEMIFGGDVDLRSDLYAAGIILYELLSGVLPFEHSEVKELLVAQVYKPAPPLDPSVVPAPIAHVVTTLLQKEPDDRFSSAQEARDALASALAVADATTIREASSPGAHATEASPPPAEATPLPRPARAPAAPTALVGHRSAPSPGPATLRERLNLQKRWPIIAAAAAAGLAVVLIIAIATGGNNSEPEPAPSAEPAGPEKSPIVSPLAIDASPPEPQNAAPPSADASAAKEPLPTTTPPETAPPETVPTTKKPPNKKPPNKKPPNKKPLNKKPPNKKPADEKSKVPF